MTEATFKMLVDTSEGEDAYHPQWMLVFDVPGDSFRVNEMSATWRRLYSEDGRSMGIYRGEEESYWGERAFECLNPEHIEHTGGPCESRYAHSGMEGKAQRAANLRRFKAAGECIYEVSRGYRRETCRKAVHNGQLFCKNHLIDTVYEQGKYPDVAASPEHKYSTLEEVVCVSCDKLAVWLDPARGRGKVIPVCTGHGQRRCSLPGHSSRGYYRTNRDERTWRVTQTHGDVFTTDAGLRCEEHLPERIEQAKAEQRERMRESERRSNRTNSYVNRDVWAFIEALATGLVDPVGATAAAMAFVERTEPEGEAA